MELKTRKSLLTNPKATLAFAGGIAFCALLFASIQPAPSLQQSQDEHVNEALAEIAAKKAARDRLEARRKREEAANWFAEDSTSTTSVTGFDPTPAAVSPTMDVSGFSSDGSDEEDDLGAQRRRQQRAGTSSNMGGWGEGSE